MIFTNDEIDNAVPLNDYFGMNGYQSMYSVINLGSAFVFLIAYLCALLFLLIIRIFNF